MEPPAIALTGLALIACSRFGRLLPKLQVRIIIRVRLPWRKPVGYRDLNGEPWLSQRPRPAPLTRSTPVPVNLRFDYWQYQHGQGQGHDGHGQGHDGHGHGSVLHWEGK